MPTYVYRCTKGHTFERFHSISDETPRRCPRCRSAAKRVPAGGGGVLFKGSGFYATDYRSKGYQESATRERGAPGEAGSGEAKSEGAKTSEGAKPAGGAKAEKKGAPPRAGGGKGGGKKE
jgi:putative FmdB family regulatory protein